MQWYEQVHHFIYWYVLVCTRIYYVCTGMYWYIMSTWSQCPSESPSESPSSHDTFLQFTWHLSPVHMTPFSSIFILCLVLGYTMIHIVYWCTSQYIHICTSLYQFISVYLLFSTWICIQILQASASTFLLNLRVWYLYKQPCQGVGDSKGICIIAPKHRFILWYTMSYIGLCSLLRFP